MTINEAGIENRPCGDAFSEGSGIGSLDDVEGAEPIPLAKRKLPESTVVALEQAARTHASETSPEFFLSAKRHQRCFRWRFSDHLASIYRATKPFDALGALKEGVISPLLSNLPKTHPTRPRAIRIVDSIPLIAVGKIYKPELRRREIERACRACLAGLDDTDSINVSVELRAEDKALAHMELPATMTTESHQSFSRRLETLGDQLVVSVESAGAQPK